MSRNISTIVECKNSDGALLKIEFVHLAEWMILKTNEVSCSRFELQTSDSDFISN